MRIIFILTLLLIGLSACSVFKALTMFRQDPNYGDAFYAYPITLTSE